MKATFEHPVVTVSETLERFLEAKLHADQWISRWFGMLRVMFMAAQQKFRHCRNHRAGEQIGGQHCENHGLAEWHEQELRDTRQEELRKEHNADRQRSHKCRRSDLLRAIEDVVFDFLAHGDVWIDVL